MRRAARGRDFRAAALAVLVLLGASVPGCLLPELIVDGSGGTGGSGSDELGGANSGGGSSTDSGGASSGGADTGGGSSSGGTDSGGGPSGDGGASSGGANTGGDGSGAASSGGTGSGGTAPLTAYYESGDWHGFVAPFAYYGTVEPNAFEVTANAPYCVSGSVQPTEGFVGVAGWTWNLNQEPTCSGSGCTPPAATTVPTTEGVLVRVDSVLATDLRVEVWGPDGAENPDQRWCRQLETASGLAFLPWGEFNTECWAGTGTAYANEELTLLRVVANGLGSGQADVPFDYCVEFVGEADAPSADCSASDGPGIGTYSLSGDESADVVRGARPYVVDADLWGTDGAQTIEGTGTSFEVTGSSSEAFPAVFVGDIAGVSSGTSEMPRLVDSGDTLLVNWDWTGGFGTSVAALELRFSAAASASTPPSSYLEIWVDGATGTLPIGTSQGTVNIDSMTWTVFLGEVASEGVPIVTFRATTPPTSFQADVQDFIDVADTNGWITGTHLTSIAAGFELFGGTGAGLVSTDFCVVP